MSHYHEGVQQTELDNILQDMRQDASNGSSLSIIWFDESSVRFRMVKKMFLSSARKNKIDLHHLLNRFLDKYVKTPSPVLDRIRRSCDAGAKFLDRYGSKLRGFVLIGRCLLTLSGCFDGTCYLSPLGSFAKFVIKYAAKIEHVV